MAKLDEPPARDVYVTGEVMEDGHEGHAMRYVDEELDVDLEAVVIGEASEMNVKRGHRGRCELAVHSRERRVTPALPIEASTPSTTPPRWSSASTN